MLQVAARAVLVPDKHAIQTPYSYVGAASSRYIIVRRDSDLFFIDFPTQNTAFRIDIGVPYLGEPGGIFEEAYYELHTDFAFRVELGDAPEAERVSRVPYTPLPGDPAGAYSVCFDGAILTCVENRLVLVYLDSLEWKVMNA